MEPLSVYTLRCQPLRLGLRRNRESGLLFPPQLLYFDGSIDHWEGLRPPDHDHLWYAHAPLDREPNRTSDLGFYRDLESIRHFRPTGQSPQGTIPIIRVPKARAHLKIL